MPQADQPAWENALNYYLELMNNYGPPGASTNGYNENQALFQQGKCAMWLDANWAAGRVFDPSQSEFADKVGITAAPIAETENGNAWFWAWSLAIPKSSEDVNPAKDFLA